MKRLCLVLVMCLIGTTVHASIDSQPYITGDFNGWAPGDITMTETSAGSGIWTYTISGLTAGQWQTFKITQGDWDVTVPASNSWACADENGDIIVTFNTNVVSDGWVTEQYRITLNTEPGTWSLVGDYNGWNNADSTQTMTALGGGIYSITQTWAAGEYNFKPTWTGTWNAIGTDGRSIDAWNYYLNLDVESEVTVYVDAYANTMKVEVVPEPATLALLAIGSVVLSRRRK